MRSTVLFILMCGCATAQTSAIEGVAIDSVTHQPVPGVHISLRLPPVDGVASAISYGAMSQRDGRFSIVNLPPAIYDVATSRAGYVPVPNANDHVELKPGEQRAGFTITMTPRATISGRVTDEYGDPVSATQVQAVPAKAGAQTSSEMSALTDERGQFRMIGAPGRYQVAAEVYLRAATPEIRHDGVEPAVRGTTWYPASSSKERAAVVEVAAGRDLSGIDIQLQASRSLAISGHMTGVPVRTLQENSFTAVVVSALGDKSDGSVGWMPVRIADDGSFSLPGLASGRYRLTGRQDGDHPLRSVPVEVDLGNTNVDSVVLKMGAGETLAGLVEVQNANGRTAPVPKIGVRIDAPNRSQTTETGSDGVFHLEKVFANTYRVSLQPLPEDTWLKSIRVDDKEVSSAEIDLTGGASSASLRIMLSPGAGRIEGKVVGEDGATSPAEPCLVILSQAKADGETRDEKLIQSGEKFQFTNLAPGKYRLLAIPGSEAAGGIDSLKAAEIVVHEGDKLIRDIKVAPPRGSDAAK